jgi:hypothetical protein
MWDGLQDDVRDLVIGKAEAAPATLEDAMADADWWYLFGQFCDASGQLASECYAFASQDPDAAAANADGADLEYGRAVFERQKEEMALPQLRELYQVFPDEVYRIQAWNATTAADDERWQAQDQLGAERTDPRPMMSTELADSLDADYIQRVNEYSWEAAKDGGDVDYMFTTDPLTLLVGLDNFPANYRQAMRNSGASQGTITVEKRGRALSAGAVTVSGRPDESAFKKAFKNVSNKSVRFG